MEDNQVRDIAFLHDRQVHLLVYILYVYKAEMLSVRLQIDVTLLSQPFWNVLTRDLVYVIAVVSGTSKFVFISL